MKFNLKKDEYLVKRKRMSRMDIAKEYNITYQSLMYHLRKWDLNDTTREQAEIDNLKYTQATSRVLEFIDAMESNSIPEEQIDKILGMVKGIGASVSSVSRDLLVLHREIYMLKNNTEWRRKD